MTLGTRLDGAVPADPGASRDVAIAALTRRVAELEHRLNMMKIVIGLVLAVKVIIVAMFVYVLLETGLLARREGPTLRTTAITRWLG